MNHKIIFLGRGYLGLDVLNRLLKAERFEVTTIFICSGDTEVGLCDNQFKAIAHNHKIPIYFENNLNQEWVLNKMRAISPDLMVGMLWRHTISEQIVQASRLGILNLHAGDLPRYRGNACQTWAILNEEKEIGICVHLMEGDKLDSGPIVIRESVPIGDSSAVGDLINEINKLGPQLVIKASKKLLDDRDFSPEIQNEARALRCFPRIPRDGEIDWNMSAWEISKLVRAAGFPYPGAYTYFEDIRDRGAIKKLNIDTAEIGSYESEFCSVPGHLLKIGRGGKWGIVCGDQNLLILKRIRIDGIEVPVKFGTIRQRMGIDVQNKIAYMDKRLGQMGEELAAFRTQFNEQVASLIEECQNTIQRLVREIVVELESQAVCTEVNPMRNYSFQKKYFDWEKKERWFHYAIYQSFRLTEIKGEPYALGLWFFSDTNLPLELRAYISIKPEVAVEYAPIIDEILRDKDMEKSYDDSGILVAAYKSYAEKDSHSAEIFLKELAKSLAHSAR